jgi:hypothetical protein
MPWTRETILTVWVDFDAVGHYARSDVFRLEVDKRPMPDAVTGRSSACRSDGEIIDPQASEPGLFCWPD